MQAMRSSSNLKGKSYLTLKRKLKESNTFAGHLTMKQLYKVKPHLILLIQKYNNANIKQFLREILLFDYDHKVFQITFLFSKPPQFQPLLKYWGHMKNFYSETTNYGVDGKNSPSTPQIVVSFAKIHL